MTYLLIKWLHVISSTVLFGTGIGSAFYLLAASVQRDARVIAAVARYVVIADWLFTATTVILQPLSGGLMMHLAGLPLRTPWLLWSIVLYAVAVACWLPVVWLQMRMRDLARHAAEQNAALPAGYWRAFRYWVALGVPAFLAFVAVFYLMVVKALP
ncbi:hypothetical protein B5P43_05655 [Bacillus sp. SRB_336]|nr:hypothetical protein B5P43_05655 [Bacillus sp. SRB_336]